MRGRLLAVVVGSAIVLGGGAFAFGRITAPAADGKIYSCYVKQSGALRIVSKGTRCRATEARLAWNQIGPRGPAGTPPPNGPMRVVGTRGAAPYGPFMQAYDSPPYANLAYYHDADGIVHLNGLACRRNLSTPGCIDGVGFSGSQIVFTLPPGLRPLTQHVFAVTTYGFGKYATGRVDVMPDGEVTIVYPPQSGIAWISFDGISWRLGA
jgi:hypothetical protein